MRKAVCLLIAFVVHVSFASAQLSKDVALTIDGKPIYKKELQKEFEKGQLISSEGHKESFDKFLDSYIQQKMMLLEAKAQRIDTVASYLREMKAYQHQLTQSYTIDTVSSKELTEEFLERFEHELELNHAFIPFEEKDVLFSADTLTAFNKAIVAREVALTDGFEKLDKSNEPQTFGVILNVENTSGYMGWVRPFMFSYDLEKIIYSLEHGKVSMPIRSSSGYHIFQVLAKRPAQGNPIIEQVIFNFPMIPATKHIEDSVYKVAIRTYDQMSIRDDYFQVVCDEYSRAFSTEERGCLLGEISVNTKVPSSLIQAAFELTDIGEVSKPVLTAYGYHILRLKDKLPVPTRDDRRESIQSYLSTAQALPRLIDAQRLKLLKDNKGEINQSAYEELAKLTEALSPHDSIYRAKVTNKSDVLITLEGNKQYIVQDLLDYMEANAWLYQSSSDTDPVMQRLEVIVKHNLSIDILQDYMNGFTYAVLANYEKEMLESRYPSFKKTMESVSNGLMYTTLMDREIWRKSKVDFEGLEKVFLKNRDKYTLDGEYFKGLIIQSRSETSLKEIESSLSKNRSTASKLKEEYNKDETVIQVAEGLWQEGDNEYVDTKIYKSASKKPALNFPYYTVVGEFISTPRDFTDVKAQVESDYQQELEEEWMSYLKNKYEVVVNKAVIKKIK